MPAAACVSHSRSSSRRRRPRHLELLREGRAGSFAFIFARQRARRAHLPAARRRRLRHRASFARARGLVLGRRLRRAERRLLRAPHRGLPARRPLARLPDRARHRPGAGRARRHLHLRRASVPAALLGAALVIAGIIGMSGRRARAGGAGCGARSGSRSRPAPASPPIRSGTTRASHCSSPSSTPSGLDSPALLILAPPALRHAVRRAQVATDLPRTAPRHCSSSPSSAPAPTSSCSPPYTLAPVSYVAPAREISILFGALLGLHLLKADAARRLAGAGAIVAGVFALAVR